MPSLAVQRLPVERHLLLCDVSTGQPRRLVPPAFQEAVFQALHGVAHPGSRATRRLISSRFVWHGMASDILSCCRDCQACARAKVHRHIKAPLQEFEVPARKFSPVHSGPLPALVTGTHPSLHCDRLVNEVGRGDTHRGHLRCRLRRGLLSGLGEPLWCA